MTLSRLAPALFVFLWASGFIGARYAMPWAEPFSFLSARFFLAIVLIGAMMAMTGRFARWTGRAIMHSAVAGVLLHGIYLGGVFWAIHRGMPAGLAALLVGLHPLVTALLAGRFLGEKVTNRHWIGLFVGFSGVAMVLSPDFGSFAAGVDWANLVVSFISVLGLSAGSLWQKRFVRQDDLIAGTLFQYAGALVFTTMLAALLESQTYTLTAELVFAMFWLVFVLSLGAILLLMLLIREGQASRVASLFYLVPAVTALQAWILFGESLVPVQIAGMLVAAFGVALALAQPVARARASR